MLESPIVLNTSNENERGNLILKEEYVMEASGMLRKVYEEQTDWVYVKDPFKAISAYGFFDTQPGCEPASALDIKTNIYSHNVVTVQRQQTISTSHGSNDNSTVSTTQTMDYDDEYPSLMSSESVVNSDGKTYTTEYFYTDQYPSGIVKNGLLDQNRVLPAWQSIKTVDDDIVDGTRTFYDHYDASGAQSTTATDFLYPSELDRREITWSATGTKIDDGWITQDSIYAYQTDVGKPAEILSRGWADPQELTWTSTGQLENWYFIDYEREYSYNEQTELLQSIIEIDSTVTSYTYDGLLRLKTTTDSRNAETTLTYHYSSGVDDLNFVQADIHYPEFGEGLSAQTISSKTIYDGLGREVQTLLLNHDPDDENKHISTWTTYDNVSRPVRAYEPVIATSSDYVAPFGDYTESEYEQSRLNRAISITPPLWHATSTKYSSNGSGEVILDHDTGATYAPGALYKVSSTDPENQTVEIFTDRRGNQILQRVKATPTTTNASLIADTYTLFDNKDRPVMVLPPEVTTSQQDLIFKTVYSGDDLVLIKDDPDCAPVEFAYDLRDLMIARQDGQRRAEGNWYRMMYDEYGRSITEGFSTQITSDILDTLINNTWGASGFEEGKIISCTKSILNQDSDIEIIKSYEYDDVGRLEVTRCNSVLHPQSGSIENIVAYDSQDKIIESFQNIIPDQITIRNRWTYDHVGRQKKAFCQVTTPDLDQASGLMTWPEQELSELSYNAKELITELNIGNGLQNVDYRYLPNRLLRGINFIGSTFQASGDLWAQTIGYFNDQNIDFLEWDHKDESHSGRYYFNYDFLKRITEAHHDDAFDRFDRYNATYSYADHRGNIETLTRRSEGTTIDNLTYSYINNTNQIKSITDGASAALKSNGFKAISTDDYVYDDNGAMTFDQGRNADYSYNHLNLPYQIAIPDSSGFVRYYYTGDGTLHRQEEIRDSTIYLIRDYIGGIEYVNGAIDQIIHDNGYIALEKGFDEDHLRLTGSDSLDQTYNSISTVSDRIVPNPREIEYISEQMIILTEGFEVILGADFLADIDTFLVQGLDYRYFLKDHLGSVRVEFKDDGNGTAVPTNVTNYYPFGLPWDSDTDTRNNWTYTGQELQRSFDLGLQRFDFRFYDPTIARFIEVDPIAAEFPHAISEFHVKVSEAF
jgi:RHS repeat-associated protein